MNKVILTGRATKDLEIKYTAGSGTAVINFSIAVPDDFNKDKTDFFNIVAYAKTAEHLAKWLEKGKRVAIDGRLTTRHYTHKDGHEVYITEVVAGRAEIIDWPESPKEIEPNSDFEEMEPIDDGDIPF